MAKEEALVLPRIGANAFLVNPEMENVEEERERKRKRAKGNGFVRQPVANGQQPSRSKFLVKSRREPQAFAESESDGAFIPKTLSGGSSVKPNGFARRMAETRSQEVLSTKQPPKAARIEQRPRRTSKKESLAGSESAVRDDRSSDSGIASGEKADSGPPPAPARPRASPDANNNARRAREASNASSKSSQAKRAGPGPDKRPPAARPPPPRVDLPKEDSGLRSNDSPGSPREDSPDQGLFYDRQGNLILRERKVVSVQSEPAAPKLRNTENDLRKTYLSRFPREEGDRRAEEAAVHRREPMLTRREAEKWDDIHGVYGASVERQRQKRHNRFLSRLEQVQLDAARKHNREVIEAQTRSIESKKRQQMQLWMVRSRFQEEQEKRFFSQWVTMKTLQHEKCDRHLYGLPEDLFGAPEHPSQLRRKKPTLIKVFDYKKKREQNKEAYRHYLEINAGANFDTNSDMPKVEPPDNVDVNVKTHSGKRWKDDELKVKEILRDAKHELRAEKETPRQQSKPQPKPQRRSNITYKPKPAPKKPARAVRQSEPLPPKQLQVPETKVANRRVPSLTSLRTVDFMKDDSDAGSQIDAFERARIKYNLYMDSDEEV